MAPLGFRALETAGACGIRRADVDGHAELDARPLGEADVVAVAVGEHDAADVGELPPQSGELAPQPPVVACEPRVDDGDAVGLGDEVHRDHVVPDAVDSLRDLHVGYGT